MFHKLKRTTSQLENQKSTTKTIHDFSVAMAILIGLSLLPFIHELLINEDGTLAWWVPDLGIEKALTNSQGKVLGYSKYRVLLFFLFAELSALIAWIGWYSVAKGKNYEKALLLPIFCACYHIFLIISVQRKTWLNDFDLKIYLSLGTLIVLMILAYRYSTAKRKLLQIAEKTFGHPPTKYPLIKVALAWLFLIFAATLPYIHDILTLPRVGTKPWVPNFGIEYFLTISEGNVWGFRTYRTFLLMLSLQIFAHIPLVGWIMDARYKKYRPFIFVPLALSALQIVVILLDKTDSLLSVPNFKLFITLTLGILIGYIFFFRNKGFKHTHNETNAGSPASLTKSSKINND